MGKIIVRSLDPKAFILDINGSYVDVTHNAILEVDESNLVEEKIKQGKLAVVSRVVTPASVAPEIPVVTTDKVVSAKKSKKNK